MSDKSDICERTRAQIDAYLDDDLEAGERAGVESHCAGCDACASELELAVRIRDELRGLPVFEAPARVIEAASREATASNVVPLPSRPARRRRVMAVVAAGIVAVAALSVWFGVARRSPREPGYSDAEIRRASAEVALAFGYIDEYGDQAAVLVRDDVLQQRVMPRIERALEASGEAAIHDALIPSLKRAARESGLGVTNPGPGRS